MTETNKFELQSPEDDTIESPLDAAEKQGTIFLEMDSKLSYVERLITKAQAEIQLMPDARDDDPKLNELIDRLNELESQRQALMEEMCAIQIRIDKLFESAEELEGLTQPTPPRPHKKSQHQIAQA